MSIHAALTHRTSYHYDAPATLGPQTIRLRPAPHCRTPILAYSLKVEPAGHFLNWQQDPQGNFLARAVFPERVDRFVVTVDLIADMATINPFDFFLEPEAEHYPFAYDPLLEDELAPFRVQPPLTPALAALLQAVPRDEKRTVDLLVAVNRLVQGRVAYVVRMEPGVQTPDETLAAGQGSCRDSAWLLVALLRHLGFAARFVSGYLIQLKADETPLEGPAGPAQDFTDLHAWAEAYLPGAGWVGLDATSGLLVGEGHIPLAATPSPQSAAPVSGLVSAGAVDFGFTMEVRRIAETPRVSQPYSDAQWQDILACGRRVDRLLKVGDVRLTMGGEPTFVAARDNEAPEWTADALGPSKRGRAARLMRRLAPLWAPGAALLNGMGKHYPGEQLPRWVLHAVWRADGEAAWRDPEVLVDPDCDRGTASVEDARRFALALAERLQVDPQRVLPAHEDVHYFLWREARLPANVVAEAAKLSDPLARARMTRVFSQGLAAPVGSVLPLRRIESGGGRRWQSGRWFLRDETLFLVPGDSHVGLRLPLESLPWAEQEAIETPFAPDPFAPAAPLPSRAAIRQQNAHDDARWELAADHPLAPPVAGVEQPELVRTALAVEPRQGLLSVFLPPLYEAEDWLALVAAIEDTAQSLGTPVMLEGYAPVDDDRLRRFSITPDPGVIEVNVHPAESFAEHVERGEQLYEAARAVGLRAEKFMLDGRHVGTGGGNHVVLGAANVADSPFLRRPDLLKSLVSFWHNHPSLSFAFAGLFIGPMSQHPRVDEARQDALNELDIAFSQIAPFRDVPPWLIDRLLRNILADMQGNTHRTEFCIDKMYDPSGPAGRRGLVEFRAFEMPPHNRMAATQALLMRAAVAAFWQTPYQRRLLRWGSRLHDDFMLPAFCLQDFADALEELGGGGLRLEPEWFAPHFAFRFPVLGEVAVHGMSLELRHALEPWHVLAEDPAAGGTVRYVESSVERLQARVSFWNPERFALACNGHAVPLSATETAGEYVAGIRFKAWDPPNALHPALPAQTPLVFDVYDRWSGRSLGGLTHHVAHPGGRSYETYPVNANEAEARRRSRFQPFGHAPGPMPEPVCGARNREYPRTLDLRAAAAAEAVYHH
jgi:uncharacterized protein (DUF2126 family)/transglutaminase-like putative cysteine protease